MTTAIPIARRVPPQETRTAEQLWEQYTVEKELATRLRHASEVERRSLYSSLYEELFRRIPHHPQLRHKISAGEHERRIAAQMSLLRPWLNCDTNFLEIGAGDCALSLALTAHVAQVYAVDVSETITRTSDTPRNFTLLISDGTSIPVPEGQITLAFSNQLMEHLHPHDALAQLSNIYRVLAPGGIYVCVTPSRLSGPHDISRYFDTEATGFHLKEYTAGELIGIFRHAGFRTSQQCIPMPRGCASIPTALWVMLERVCESLPSELRMRVLSGRRAKRLFQIRLIARK